MKKVISTLICLFFVLATLITVIDVCCFDRSFYETEYQKTSTANRIGVSDQDLETLTDVVLDYLKDKDKTMDIKLEVKGKVQEVFTDRAKAHMIDVRDLYFNTILVRNISASLFVILLIGALLSKQFKVMDFYKAYINVLIFFGVVFLFIGIYALIDFNSFWTNFHHVFFDNDLWLLEYNDVLVNMVNETFFFDLVIKIVSIILVIIVVVYGLLRKFRYEN